MKNLFLLVCLTVGIALIVSVVALNQPTPSRADPSPGLIISTVNDDPANRDTQLGFTCCPDCTAVKRFVDAICDKASGIPTISSICNKYAGN